MTDFAMRDAVEADLDAMRAILNKEIRESTATWTTVERSSRAMRKWWMDLRRDGYPTLVATKNGYLLGYAAYGRFCTWLGTGVRRKTPSMCAPTHRVRASVGRC